MKSQSRLALLAVSLLVLVPIVAFADDDPDWLSCPGQTSCERQCQTEEALCDLLNDMNWGAGITGPNAVDCDSARHRCDASCAMQYCSNVY